MTQPRFALLISLFFISVLSANSFAQSTTSTLAPGTSTATPVSAPAAVPPPTPWKLSYYAELQSARFSNFDLTKTQGANDSISSYSEIDHAVKIGYAVSKAVNVGTQIRGAQPLDPAQQFSFPDLRFYGSWNHMVETQDIDMQGVLKVELPTTTKSRTAGKLVAFKIENNWTFKSALRNWSFTASTLIKPVFYNDPYSGGGKTDLIVALSPYITVDLTPSTQLLFEGSFDAAHNYTSASYDYTSGDPDYFDVGPVFTLSPSISTNVAMRFFTDIISFNTACLYLNFSWAM